jgi:nucleoside-diphosphate-sugar epimerase
MPRGSETKECSVKGLIGHSGFVGSTLLRQTSFDKLYRSSDIERIRGEAFDMLVCAGVPAQKWIAERDPESDIANIKGLAAHLDTLKVRIFVLISTVDVFADSRGADEATAPDESTLTAYGRNRLWLERFVADRFGQSLIIRLPALVGPGLRKNVVFDLRNHNALHLIDARGVYQFYPMVCLWPDIEQALAAGLDIVHFTAMPISVAEVAAKGFGLAFDNVNPKRQPATYDFQTRYAALFGGTGAYTYSARDSLLAIRAYAQSESPSKPIA